MHSRNKLKEMLDSDDELPTHYKEPALIPAYQDNNRFTDSAIYKFTKDLCGTDESLSDTLSSSKTEDEFNTITKERRLNSVLQGVLSRKDAYCIKVFGMVYNDEKLLWFINYTISKDFLSVYSYLISCLVSDIYDNTGKSDRLSNNNKEKRQLCDSKYIFKYK